MKSIVVLQARTDSTRLPAKVLLPIEGTPLVVLAAKRAANTGRNVVVVTSTEQSDDHLVKVLESHGINYFRGSLSNVLKRFVDALIDYDDSTLVYRLTADNPIPDGHLLDEIETDFVGRALKYLVCNGPGSGLPYGVSAEVTYLEKLREAHQKTLSPYDREHVTAFVARDSGVSYFEKYRYYGMGHFRCTVDSLDDYQSIVSVFEGVIDPVGEKAIDLVKRLRTAKFQPSVVRPVSKLVLGTAQLGLNYGVNNSSGIPENNDGSQLIKTAIINGALWLDTARAYGSSEERIGAVLSNGWYSRVNICTKLSPLDELSEDLPVEVIEKLVDASVFESLTNLRVQKIDALLLHRANHLNYCGGTIWRRLLHHRLQGRVGALGVSVQCPEELMDVLEVPEVEHIQLPLNLLDWRWQAVEDSIRIAKSSRKLTVHARSAFLQGLLLSQDESSWGRAGITSPDRVWDWMYKCVQKYERASLADLCTGYALGHDWVDAVAIGVETKDQLEDIMQKLQSEPLTTTEIRELSGSRPLIERDSLNPALWRGA